MHREVLYEERKMFPALNVPWSPFARPPYCTVPRPFKTDAVTILVAPICAYLFTLSRALVPAWLC